MASERLPERLDHLVLLCRHQVYEESAEFIDPAAGLAGVGENGSKKPVVRLVNVGHDRGHLIYEMISG